ncbi:Tannase/feruloyl esterase [Dactylonectria macrodidyma]|uniref:Carboxylic ester hydrolase n=1 Tax=Dactylonectria macrodidyma TaxID=307937 RepID=A0A9P9D2F9_9HYPO|nr:Tannase/feruloyl esterase [Dactylonectria macrodidyma]
MLAQHPFASPSTACSSSTFANLRLFGAETLSLTAETVSNLTRTVPSAYTFHHPTLSVENASFCNVTVSYTHPGQDDLLYVETWLPMGHWNERLQAVGGGGWVAGRSPLSEMAMVAALSEGYAAVTTDAGLRDADEPSGWALINPGNINLYALHNLASASLGDEAFIAKSLIKDFYGKPPKFSYWSGCSQGGQWGLMLAQRYPTAYDGIVASAPAINWAEVLTSAYWPQFLMKKLGQYRHPCEFTYLAQTAIEGCDLLDGVADGVISDEDACHFDPFPVVRNTIECSEGKQLVLSKGAATISNATWSGLRASDGRFLWYGLGYGADITGGRFKAGTALTSCDDDTCVSVSSPLVNPWFQLFVEKDASFDVDTITYEDLDRIYHMGVSEYNYMLGTNYPDLSAFRNAGWKLLTFHGLEDQIIPPQGTGRYYRSVASRLPDVDDFYRRFEIPGLAHCFGGNNATPKTSFEQLRAWVESGTKPDTVPVSFVDTNGQQFSRRLCPFPQKARFEGGDPTKDSNFSCRS